MIKAIIFDFNRTIYDPDSGQLSNETESVLSRLHPLFKMALISLGADSRRNLILSLNLEKYFDFILVTPIKQKSHFLDCCRALGCDPNETVVVGDRIKSEITLGNQLGMKTIWFKQGYFSTVVPENKIEEPSFTVSSFKGVESILHNL